MGNGKGSADLQTQMQLLQSRGKSTPAQFRAREAAYSLTAVEAQLLVVIQNLQHHKHIVLQHGNSVECHCHLSLTRPDTCTYGLLAALNLLLYVPEAFRMLATVAWSGDCAFMEGRRKVLLTHCVHVLNPHCVHGPIKKQPLPIGSRVLGSLPECFGQHPILPLMAAQAERAQTRPAWWLGNGLGVSGHTGTRGYFCRRLKGCS